MAADKDIYLFEGFRLDRCGDGLCRRDERGIFVPVAIGLRALDLLGVLVERAGELVSKEEIMAAVWGRTVVETANLTVQISALRRVLDEGRTEGSCIQTVAARGYRFVASVSRVAPELSPAMSSREPLAAPPRPRTLGFGSRRRHARIGAIAALLAAALVMIGVSWRIWVASGFSTANSLVSGSAAPHLSIVVLPFADLSAAPGQQYLADAIAET